MALILAIVAGVGIVNWLPKKPAVAPYTGDLGDPSVNTSGGVTPFYSSPPPPPTDTLAKLPVPTPIKFAWNTVPPPDPTVAQPRPVTKGWN